MDTARSQFRFDKQTESSFLRPLEILMKATEHGPQNTRFAHQTESGVGLCIHGILVVLEQISLQIRMADCN